MDELVYASGSCPYAEFLGPFRARATKSLAFCEGFIYRNGPASLLGSCFADEVRDPTGLVTVPLLSEALVDAHHFAKELALSAPLLPG